MADESTTLPTEETAKTAAPASAGKSRSVARTRRAKAAAPIATQEEVKPAAEEPKAPRVPRRATLDPATARALSIRRSIDHRRPLFIRTASHRYFRIGRDESWRRPRGLQSKQRRHYGYRPVVVSVGFRSPARVRGLVPSGFRPVLVETTKALEKLDPLTQAAILARGIGTRRRLVLEEAARRLGVRVLNPIATPKTEE